MQDMIIVFFFLFWVSQFFYIFHNRKLWPIVHTNLQNLQQTVFRIFSKNVVLITIKLKLRLN